MKEETVESERNVYSNKKADAGFAIGLLAIFVFGVMITSISWKDEAWLLFMIGILMCIFSLFFFLPFYRRLFSSKPLFTMSAHGIQVHMHAFPLKSFPIHPSIQWNEVVLAGFIKVSGVQQVHFYNGHGEIQLRLPVPAAYMKEMKEYIKRQGIEVQEAE